MSSLDFIFGVKDMYCPSKKEGGIEGYHSIRLELLHRRRCFFWTLKGLTHDVNYKKRFQRLGGKKRGVILYMTFARRVVMLRYSPCGDTSATVVVMTNGIKKEYFFKLAAKQHVSSQLRWRPLTYRHRGCRATSSIGAPLSLYYLVLEDLPVGKYERGFLI
jgi:hypothetical protein